MRIHVAILALALLALAACGNSGPGSTPEDTFASFKSAMQSEDYESVYDLIPPKQREMLDEQLGEMKKQVDGPMGEMMLKSLGLTKDEFMAISDPQELFAVIMEKQAEKERKKLDQMLEAEITDSKVQEDSATLTIKSGDYTETLRFVRIDDLWYIEME